MAYHLIFLAQEAIRYYEPIVKKQADTILEVPAIVLANLCVSHIMISQNEEAEELMRKVCTNVKRSQCPTHAGSRVILTLYWNARLCKGCQRMVHHQAHCSFDCCPTAFNCDDYVPVQIEKEEEKVAQQDPDKQCFHLCIVNLVIGTLYCAKVSNAPTMT